MRIIKSSCNAVVKKRSILVEEALYTVTDRLISKIKDTNNILEIIDDINESALSQNCVLVNFDVVSMFSNIDN